MARYERGEKGFRKREFCITNIELKQERFHLGFVLSSFMILVMRLALESSIYINLIIENFLRETEIPLIVSHEKRALNAVRITEYVYIIFHSINK